MKYYLIILTTALSITTLFGQNKKATADEYFKNGKWNEAANGYKHYLKSNERDSAIWFNLAMCNYYLKDYNSAIRNFKLAEKNNYSISFTSFYISKSYLSLHQIDEALNSLEEGAAKGLFLYTRIKSDTLFNSVRLSDRFVKVLSTIEKNAYPCLKSENYRHFDFWLGDWDVFVNGTKVGENLITMAKGGCAIHENYTTAGNYAGQSINYYDPIDKKWHQHWVGSGGDVYNYLETDRKDGMLQFESKFMNANGQITLSRLTFTLAKDGSVRQLFENSSDNGVSWTSSFDGHYIRKK